MINQVISLSSVERLNLRLERILRGEYDKATPPDKRPKLVKAGNKGLLGFSGHPRKRTLQIINVWKCDRLFESLVMSPKYVVTKKRYRLISLSHTRTHGTGWEKRWQHLGVR